MTEVRPHAWNRNATMFVRAEVGVQRIVRGLTKDDARKLAHEMALAVRLRGG